MAIKSRSPEIAAAAAELTFIGATAERASAGECGCSRPLPGMNPNVGSLAPREPGPQFGGGQVECAAFPLGDFRTNDNFIFLREILQTDGSPADPTEAGNCLVEWLADTASGVGQPEGQANGDGLGVLVIDQMVLLTQSIAIPPRMTIMGVGINGAGRLHFSGALATPAISFLQPSNVPPCWTAIQDLAIEYVGDEAADGVYVDRLGDIVYLRRVAMRGWSRAFVNGAGYSVIVEQSIFEDNDVHIDLPTIDKVQADITPDAPLWAAATATKIRECVFTGASGPAVRLQSPGVAVGGDINGNSCLITGCAFTDNEYGVYVDRHQAATLIGNSFVGNSVTGVYVTSNAREARVIANYFDQGDRLAFEDVDELTQVGVHHHEWGFNTFADAEDAELEILERLTVERIYYRSATNLAD